jgi:membrane protein
MLVGATTVFAELQDTLDHIWRAPARPANGLWHLLRARVLSFGLILGVGFLLVVSLLFNTALAVAQHWWAPGLGEIFAGVAGQFASFTLMTLLFAMIYKTMPRARIAWTDVWIGALVTAGLLTAGRHGIGLAIAASGAAAGYGAAGSLVVLLLWVYYSAQIFLLGAEFTWVYAHALGSHRDTAPEPP